MKIFLDCGYYVGKALEYYAPLMDDSWVVYAFEPNRDLQPEKTIERFPFKINLIKKAIWIKDGRVAFRVTGREDASHIDSVRTSTDKKITVPCIDFSKFVAELPKDATIICSMDIEGAEYSVLNKMLADGTAQRISLLDIEFHHRLLNDIDEGDSSRLRSKLELQGTLVKLKLGFS